MFLRVILIACVSLTFALTHSTCSGFQNRGLRGGRNAPQVEEISAAKVRKSIADGVKFLSSIRKSSGGWKSVSHLKHGSTALITLALLNAGVSAEDLEKSLQLLEGPAAENLSTYVVSLRIMAFALADPEGRRYRGRIQEDVRFLERTQTKTGINTGAWSYGQGINRGGGTGGDASNSQFALLALHEAASLGIKVDEEVWKLAKINWERLNSNGGFMYSPGQRVSTGSMTCAGISSWIIIHENLAKPEDFLSGGKVACCGAVDELDVVRRAINWMGRNFTVRFNPVGGFQKSAGAKMYYLYGMERAGRLSGERFFGDRDWYREGASHLLETQKAGGKWVGGGHLENNPELATAFGLLFLSKGKRPVVFGKYQHSDSRDWDLHPRGVHYLTRQLEADWNLKLNWQTVRGFDATVDDLLEAPVLFISGRDELRLTDVQKANLKKYIENGGFIFAEACQGDGCGDNVPFDRSFRELVAELFPEGKLEPLAPDHPIWRANHAIKPDPGWPLLGLQACCRTSIVYCPRNLAGYWRLNRKNLMSRFNNKIEDQVEYCSKIGVNVAAYATGRELDEKGSRPKIAEIKSFQMLEGRSLQFAKLDHAGGADDAPNAWRNLQTEVKQLVPGLRIKMDKKMISPNLEQLADHPFVFMHGRAAFEFTREQRRDLARYLELGGCVFADSICTSDPFSQSFRREFNQLLEDYKLEEIPADDEMLSRAFGYSFREGVDLQSPDPTAELGFRSRKVQPKLEGIKIGDRWAVVFSPYDLSCALENATAAQCEGYSRESAIKIGTNVILYRLSVD